MYNVHCIQRILQAPRLYSTFFILNSAVFVGILILISRIIISSESFKTRKSLTPQQVTLHEQLKFHAQLS